MGYLAAQGAILAIGIVIGLICSVIGLFFGHIILFDSIALGIVLPVFIIDVVFVIGLNMVDQRAVPIPEILPSLVAVALTVKGTINAELGLVIPATCISGLLALGALFLVQRFEQRISAGKGQLFALLQLVAFAPNDCHHRLHSRIKGRRQFLCRIRSGVALCKRLFRTLLDSITDMQRIQLRGRRKAHVSV